MLAILLTFCIQAPGVEARLAQGDDKTKEAKTLKIVATAAWQYVKADPNGPRAGEQFIIRTAKELADRQPFNLLEAPAEAVEKMATATLAKALKVDTIDWTKQMLVVVTAGVKSTGGYRVEIAELHKGDGVVTVKWTLHTPKGVATQAFTHPAQVALVNRVEGKVKFESTAPNPKQKIRPLPIRDRSELPANPAPELQETAQTEKELKVIAQSAARIGAARAGGHQVIRSGAELVKAMGGKGDADKLTAQVAKQLKVDHIDWKKHMLVMVSGGTQRTGGYSVQVNNLKVKDKTLTVHWKLNAPKPGQPVTQAFTNPAATILIERFEGEVRFDPPAAKSSGEKLERQ
jgi:hypothetical protein